MLRSDAALKAPIVLNVTKCINLFYIHSLQTCP
uniref:Uncharacterized protein n=1 Tax=Anguilla anguilla TaxID=7936 RepID=A0A0E9P6H2_ANGAN